MGELLSVFRQLPTQGLKLLGLWADPRRPTSRAADWADEIAGPAAAGRTALGTLLDRLPALFTGRPVMLAHGDFAPVNMLTDGASLTGLLDFEAVRLADPHEGEICAAARMAGTADRCPTLPITERSLRLPVTT